MISTAIKGTDTASGIDLTQLSSAGKSGGASFQKIMSKSLSSNVNNKASQNMVQTKTASGMKSTSTQQNTKQVSAQDDTAASTAKKTSDNTRSTLSDNSDKLTDAGEKIKDFLKEKLGVTDEEFEKAMADLGLCMQDLLQPANLTDLVVELTGVEDAVAIITNAGLSETLTDVIDYAKQLVSDVQAGRELTPVPAEAVQTVDTAQADTQENTVAMAAPAAKEVIFLSADAFGVLPPVSILTPEQTQYYFLSGFTAKLAGTERGITEPTPTFSACFGQAFLELHPTKYAAELVKKMEKSGAKAYLVNTGWNGTGKRITIKDTRGIIDAILSGAILNAPTKKIPMFDFEVPTELPGVDSGILDPRDTYADASEWEAKAKDLAERFNKNFVKYTTNEAGKALVAAGPQL